MTASAEHPTPPDGQEASSPPHAQGRGTSSISGPPPRKRAPGIILIIVVVAAALVGTFLYRRWAGGVSTDDAFVRADLVQVSAEVAGRIVEVAVQENQSVKTGDLLLRLDDSDYKLKIAQAEANLAAALADAQRADLAAAASRSDIKTGEVKLADAQREDRLQTTLVEGGAAGRAVADRATAAKDIAAQTLQTVRAGVQANQAAAEGAKARAAAAQAALDLARRDLSLTEVHAACDGVAAKVDAAVGELVSRGSPLLMIVPNAVYVVAHFKETDVDQIHTGLPVQIEVDAFPDVPFAGTVESIGAGTGASFSLLPADNASGNFIKVVQRVPIRIKLDHVDADGRALPVGLSVYVNVPRTPGP